MLRVIARMNVGGPALQVTGLMEGLDPERFDHRLLTGHVGPDEGDFLALRAPHVPAHYVNGLGRSPDATGDLKSFATLVAEMRRFRPDIVHTHTAKAGALGRVAARVTRTPIVVHTFHGHLLHGYFSPRVTAGLIRVERTLARLSTRLIAVGEAVRDDLLAAGIGRPDQYEVFPPGIPLAPLPEGQVARRELGLPADGQVVALIARLVPIKRVDRFVATATRVHADYPDAVFVVCGEGELIADLRKAASAIGDRFRFLGWRPDVETVYAASDVVALTSDNEGMPVSLIEAALAGVPVVSTKVGSVAEVVLDGKTGLLTGSDPEELAGGIGRLLANRDLRARMGEEARRHATVKFGQQRLVADTERLYDELISTKGSRRR